MYTLISCLKKMTKCFHYFIYGMIKIPQDLQHLLHNHFSQFKTNDKLSQQKCQCFLDKITVTKTTPLNQISFFIITKPLSQQRYQCFIEKITVDYNYSL